MGFLTNVSEVFPDSSLHVSMRSSRRRAPLLRSKPRSTAAQFVMNVAPGSDKQSPEFCPHDAALHRKRDRHGTVLPTDQLVRCLVDLRHCPSRLSTLRSMLAHQGSIYKKHVCKTVVDDTVMYRHMNCAIARVLECTSQQDRASVLLPLDFVASRSLSLMLMSRRKVETRFTVGWAYPQSMFRRAQHHWLALQTERVFGCPPPSPALFATSCVHYPAWITPRAVLIAGASWGWRRARLFASTTPAVGVAVALSVRRGLPPPSTVPGRFLPLPAR